MGKKSKVVKTPEPAGAYFDRFKVLQRFGDHLKSERAKATAQTYLISIRKFFDWLDEQEPAIEPAMVTRAEVIKWRDELRGNFALSTVNIRLSAVRSFYTWAIENGAPILNPTDGVKLRGRSGRRRHKRDELTDREVLGLLNTCRGSMLKGPKITDIRDRAILSLMAYCALRTIEIKRAEVGDLETKSGRRILWVWGKGRSEPDDFVVLPAAVEDALQGWLKVRPGSGGPLFISFSRVSYGRQLSARFIRKMVKTRLRKAGVDDPRKTTHSLRHSAISRAIRAGASPLQVQAMARHSDIKTTIGYYHERGRIKSPAEDLITYGESSEPPTQEDTAKQIGAG